MTDKEALMQIIKSLDLILVENSKRDSLTGWRTPIRNEYTIDEEPPEYPTTITVGSGVGYSSFVSVFHFDSNGKATSHGVWE